MRCLCPKLRRVPCKANLPTFSGCSLREPRTTHTPCSRQSTGDGAHKLGTCLDRILDGFDGLTIMLPSMLATSGLGHMFSGPQVCFNMEGLHPVEPAFSVVVHGPKDPKASKAPAPCPGFTTTVCLTAKPRQPTSNNCSPLPSPSGMRLRGRGVLKTKVVVGGWKSRWEAISGGYKLVGGRQG